MTILDQLAGHAKERVEQAKQKMTLEEIREQARQAHEGLSFEQPLPSCQSFPFEQALRKPEISFICECKKASPSKGLIAPKCFLGSSDHLKEIARTVSIPCLRKDFTVDEYMIYEAKLLGASAVLLICSILSEEQIREYIGICDELGLSALVEAHDEREVQTALNAKARIIGVNNRNLKDFSVDIENSRRLRTLIPNSVLFISESGVQSAEDVRKLREIGADAVLVGETLMRAEDKKAALAVLRGGS